jgi:hypothetical protein
MSEEYRNLDDIHNTLVQIKAILPTLRHPIDFNSWFWILVGFYFLLSWPGSKLDRWTDRFWYSSRYGAAWKNVDVQKRPFDCDFLHAPIGDKACHYKKNTDFFDDDKRRKLLQQTTLSEEERKEITNMPNAVTVYWEKKPD